MSRTDQVKYVHPAFAEVRCGSVDPGADFAAQQPATSFADAVERARRTPEAQADIAAARAAPTDMEIAMQEVDRAHEQALEEHRNPPTHYRGHGDGRPAQVIGLDAALSNAALADTPAVREMGGLAIRHTVPGMDEVCTHATFTQGCRICHWRVPHDAEGNPAWGLSTVRPFDGAKAPASLYDDRMVRGLARAAAFLEQDPRSIAQSTGELWDDECRAALELARKIGLAAPRGEMRNPYAPLDPEHLPSGAVLLTGPEAERYRAITAAARKAQASATAARADGAALLQLFQAFCAGVAPGKDE